MALQSLTFFNHIYRSYYSALCFYALKIVQDTENAKDIVEEVFMRIITTDKEFTESDNVRAWLYTATRNASLDHLKKEKHAKERQFDYTQNFKADNDSYDEEMIRAEVLNKILSEVKQLPGNASKIIEMSFFKGMKNEQIAELLGLSEKTVRNLKSTGLATLKERVPSDLFISFIFISCSSGSVIF